jgi:phenylalanyl-tRNA synthetase beta chain
LSQVLGLTDSIVEIENKSLTNRPDLWGHLGIAREIAALYKLKLKLLPLKEFKINKNIDLKISIENKEDCPRYLAVAIDNIKVADSPAWLKNKLLAIGQRPINNIVDITNFIMFELGQPLHAFDAAKIQGQEIIIKRSSSNKFITLDNKERKISHDILMINDQEKPLAMAGIMGGQNSEISQETKTIIIESANFNPNLIRKGSMLTGLRSEASSRFEKGLDPAMAEIAIKRAINLVQQIIPESTLISNLIDAGNWQYQPKDIEVSLEFLQVRLGKAIPLKTIKEILTSLSFTVKNKKDQLTIGVPSFRAGRDINTAEDLVEEVGRVYGYNNIEEVYPLTPMVIPETNWELKHERTIKNFLAGSLGYNEISNYSLIGEKDALAMNLPIDDHFKLKNFISSEQTLLRISLITNLLKNAQLNIRNFDKFRIFELGRVFKKKPGEDWRDPDKNIALPQQEKHLGGLVVGESPAFSVVKGTITDLLEKLNVNFEFKKDDNFLPWAEANSSLKIIINDQVMGVIGEINSQVKKNFDLTAKVAFFDLNFSKMAKIIGAEKKYKPLLKYPEVIKDLSVIINNNLIWEEIEKEIYGQSNLITKVELFDIYQAESLGADKKSLAFHLTFYNPERTLISNEIEQEINKIIRVLEDKYLARVRVAV